MKKFLSRLLFIILLAAIIVLAVGVVMKFWPAPEKTSERLTQAEYIDFTKKITISGTVVPAREAVITAPYSGYIEKIYVKIGQHVKAKDPIAMLEETLDSSEKTYPIRAPFSGTVVLTQKFVGDFVREGDATNFIAKINDLSTFYIKAEASESDINDIKLKQHAKIKVVSILDKTYDGVICSVALAPKGRLSSMGRSQARYPIKIRITNKDQRLRPGMSAIADIIISQKKDILILPHEFVGEKEDQPYVILANGKHQKVTTGMESNFGIEILSGLKNGEKVKQINYFKSME